jgi:hypothetical protein
MRAGTGVVHPTERATCIVHYDMWQLNPSEQEVWSTRQEAEPHQVILGRIERDGKKKHHAGLTECLRTMLAGERALFHLPPSLCYGEEGHFSFPAVPPDCWMLADVELIGIKGSTDEPEMERSDMLYEARSQSPLTHPT